MTKRMQDLERVARKGLREVEAYFDTAPGSEEQNLLAVRAEIGLKINGHHARERATQANEAAIALAAAKIMNVRGEALAKVLEPITGEKFISLPPADEHSNAASSKAA